MSLEEDKSIQKRFVVCFDSANGGVQDWEVMRYREADATAKVLGINGSWFDQDRPWVDFAVDDSVYKVPLNGAMAAKAPNRADVRKKESINVKAA